MHLIKYDGEIVATTTPRRVFLTERIEQLPTEDPRKRFIAAMCLYSGDIHAGELPGPYSDQAAELYAAAFVEAGAER